MEEETMLDQEKFELRKSTLESINDLKSELKLDWITFYDDTILEITYEGNTVALLSLGDKNIFDGPYIEQFEVLNSYKNQGYGKAIMTVLLSEVEECFVLPKSVEAMKFWESLGFTKEYDGVGEYVWHYTIAK